MHRGKISVRKLVEFVLRKGNIDNRKTSSHTAQEGARIHRRLQKAAGEDYQKEVFLKEEIELHEDKIIVEGRADGIFKQEDLWVIDEIKTSEVAFEQLDPGQIELFFYQAMVYAYIYSHQNHLEKIQVQLSYYQTSEKTISREIRTYDWEFLKSFLNDLMDEYHKWLVFQEDWRKVRNNSLVQLKFPYENYRKGQRELAVAAYKTLRTSQQLFVEAPTGIGKTISTLFPAFKALGEDRADRIFYLTAKTITRQVAQDALIALADTGAQAKSVTITAKDKICFLDQTTCNPDDCIYANGYYDRINEGLWDLLHHESQITRTVIEKYAHKHQLCPFELSLDVSLFCDVIIGDYNYLFDPTVYLRRFFEESEEEYYFLIDEAHNLVDRSRQMYSADISESLFKKVKGNFNSNKKILKVIRKIENEFDNIRQVAQAEKWTYHHQSSSADTLTKYLFSFSELTKEWLAENPENPGQEKILELYFAVSHFLKISEFYDDHYETTIELSKYDLKIKQFCMAPAPFLANMLNKGKASLLFSASLSPLAYYQELLGGNKDALRYRLPSPFPDKNQLVLLTNYIQTTYKKRSSSYQLIAETIALAVNAKKGNYLVFFPSYKYLDDCYDVFNQQFPKIKTIIQDSYMNEAEREKFLANFVAEPQQTLVGFCVLGGIFSEGIDLKASRLIGSIIVGVGLPQINQEQDLIKEYFNDKKGEGFSYAYQLPGMNKVLQAAGRVIRDMADKGVVLLLDQRFSSPRYQQLFPPHWQNAQVCYQPQQLKKALDKFWSDEAKSFCNKKEKDC